jgi:hypothetical protein
MDSFINRKFISLENITWAEQRTLFHANIFKLKQEQEQRSFTTPVNSPKNKPTPEKHWNQLHWNQPCCRGRCHPFCDAKTDTRKTLE